MLEVKIINKSNNPLPAYKTEYSAGMDLCANNDEEIILQPHKRTLVPTGIFIELPIGYEAQIRPRSGIAITNGVTVLNASGTVDSDFRGEIKVILINHSEEPFTIKKSERIAQMVVAKHERVNWVSGDELSDTERGTGGFGSTGI